MFMQCSQIHTLVLEKVRFMQNKVVQYEHKMMRHVLRFKFVTKAHQTWTISLSTNLLFGYLESLGVENGSRKSIASLQFVIVYFLAGLTLSTWPASIVDSLITGLL